MTEPRGRYKVSPFGGPVTNSHISPDNLVRVLKVVVRGIKKLPADTDIVAYPLRTNEITAWLAMFIDIVPDTYKDKHWAKYILNEMRKSIGEDDEV